MTSPLLFGPSVLADEPAAAIDRSLPMPLHAQFRHLLLGMIERGEVRRGRPLPAERDLARRYGVSLAPVRQAYLDLAREGVLYRVRGQGTFLREPRVVEHISVLSSFAEGMRASGHEVTIRVLRLETVPVDSDIAGALRTREHAVVMLERLGVVDGEPLAVLTAYLSRRRFPGILANELELGSLYRTLRERFGVVPVRAETDIGLVPCGTALAAELRVQPGSPLLRVQGTSFDADDQPVEYFIVHYRADRCRLRLDSFRAEEATVRPLSARRDGVEKPRGRNGPGRPAPGEGAHGRSR